MGRLSVIEVQTAEMVGAMQDPTNPPCEGPIVIHRDGVFECHGGCAGASAAFHEGDQLWPCDLAITRLGLRKCSGGSSLDELGHECNRCRNVR